MKVIEMTLQDLVEEEYFNYYLDGKNNNYVDDLNTDYINEFDYTHR